MEKIIEIITKAYNDIWAFVVFKQFLYAGAGYIK